MPQRPALTVSMHCLLHTRIGRYFCSRAGAQHPSSAIHGHAGGRMWLEPSIWGNEQQQQQQNAGRTTVVEPQFLEVGFFRQDSNKSELVWRHRCNQHLSYQRIEEAQ